MDLTDQRILSIYADLAIMQSVLAVVSVYTLPDDVLDTLIEDLDIPELAGGPFAELANAAADRFASKLAKGRARKRRGRR